MVYDSFNLELHFLIHFGCTDNCTEEELPPPPIKLAPWIISLRTIAPEDNYPWAFARRIIAPGKFAPWIDSPPDCCLP